MAKKYLFMAVTILLILLAIWIWVSRPSNWHYPIRSEDVARITLWGSYGRGSREATSQEVMDIINWFNSAHDIRNANFVGTTEESGIKVYLKSGDKFSIGRSGQDFEVQRKDKFGKLRSYWARQDNIKRLLDELAKSP